MENNIYYLNQHNLSVLPKTYSQRKSLSFPKLKNQFKCIKKFPKLKLNIIKKIFEFLNLKEQILASKINKKTRNVQYNILKAKEELILDFSLIKKFQKYLLKNAKKFISLKKLILNQLLLDKLLLNLLEALPKKNLNKFKLEDCYFTSYIKDCSNNISEKYANMISEIKSLEYIFLKNIQYFNVNEELIPNKLFPDGSKNLRKIKIISCCIINIKEFAQNFYKNKYPNLELINFSNNNIGVDIFNNRKFQDFFFNDSSKLKYVNLSSNEISNVDYEYIQKYLKTVNFVNETFKLLDLTNNAIERDSINFKKSSDFKKIFPNLKIKINTKKHAIPRNYGDQRILPITKSMLDYEKVEKEIKDEIEIIKNNNFKISKQ